VPVSGVSLDSGDALVVRDASHDDDLLLAILRLEPASWTAQTTFSIALPSAVWFDQAIPSGQAFRGDGEVWR
jgi:hypothetical protein